VAEFELMPKAVLVKSVAGCGVQFNQHSFAKFTGASPASHPDLEAKVLALAPHFVRIFYSDDQEGLPFDPTHAASPVNRKQTPPQVDKWNSFVRTVGLAQQAKATINITWQGGRLTTPEERETSMQRFAKVLALLAKDASCLKWVTIANEPNTAPRKPKNATGAAAQPVKAITPERLDDMYERLDAHLRAAGVRKQIRFMGGDLIEGPRRTMNALTEPHPLNQLAWFRHMSQHQAQILDAYSAHIYWNYQDTPTLQRRLNDVHRIVATLPNKKPVFITEYGVRSADRVVKGKRNGVDPGNFHDGTPLAKTNVAAFQHAWFYILATQLGFAGCVKWDCFFGKYDRGTQAYYALGPPPPPGHQEWEPFPLYFLLQLITTTTGAGWSALRVANNGGDEHKHLVAFQAPDKTLTILGLDDRGASTNTPSGARVDYAIGNLPANTSFTLALWNRAGGGHLVNDRTVRSDASGLARVNDVPLHSVFALTTKTLSL
jgi:hypothetical protein